MTVGGRLAVTGLIVRREVLYGMYNAMEPAMKLEIKKIGNSTGLILPKELLARLGLQQGDSVLVTEGPDRSMTLSPYEADDEETTRLAREVMRKYKNTFKALAK